MPKEETPDEYNARMNALANKVSNTVVGENLSEVVQIFSHLIVIALSQMTSEERRITYQILRQDHEDLLGSIQTRH